MKFSTYAMIACLALIVGCSGGDSVSSSSESTGDAGPSGGSGVAETAPASPTGSYGSPDQVFAAFAKATENDDWASAVTMVTDESQQMLVMGMVMQASFMTMEDEAKGKELVALMSKHGLDEAMPEDPSETVDVNEVVKDLPAFVGALAAWIAANESEDADGFPQLTEVKEVKIDGDSATGMTATEMGDRPIEFRKVDGNWKLHLAMGPPPEPSVDDIQFETSDDGKLGSMTLGEKSSGLNHAFAYNAKFFDEPCIMLVLTATEVSEEKRNDLKQKLQEEDGDTIFFAEGPNVSLTLSPEGELMGMHVWIDNSSMNSNRGPAVDVKVSDGRISGKVGMAPRKYGDDELQFQATFDTAIEF